MHVFKGLPVGLGTLQGVFDVLQLEIYYTSILESIIAHLFLILCIGSSLILYSFSLNPTSSGPSLVWYEKRVPIKSLQHWYDCFGRSKAHSFDIMH